MNYIAKMGNPNTKPEQSEIVIAQVQQSVDQPPHYEVSVGTFALMVLIVCVAVAYYLLKKYRQSIVREVAQVARA